MTRRNQPESPPEHLSERSKHLWSALVPRRAKSIERLTLLQTALEALDRADQARAIVDREGMSTTTASTGAVHVHPLVKVEKDARQQFLLAWEKLGLGWDMEQDGGLPL